MAAPKRNTRLLYALLIGSCLLIAVTYIGRLVTKAQLDAQIAQKSAAIAEAQENQAALEAELRYVRSDAYLQEVAHDELNLVQPDEEIIVVVTTVPPALEASPATEESTTPTEPFWRRWLAQLGFS